MNKKALLGGIALLAAIAAGLGFFWPFSLRRPHFRLPGIVEIQEVRLGSKIGGRVKDILAEEGRPVSGDQPLVVLEVPELEAQRDQAEARVKGAAAELQKAENGPRWEEKLAAWAHMEGAGARYERLYNGPREEEILQAKSDWESSQAEFKQAQQDYERVASLYQKQSVSRADYDAALSFRDRAQGRLQASRARYELLKNGSRKEDIAEAKADWAKAQAKFIEILQGTRPEDIAEARARLEEAKARLQEIQTHLKEAVVRCPKEAIVEVIAVRKGDLVLPNQTVARVLYSEDLWVKAYVPEPELGKVRLGQNVEVSIDTYPNKRFPGTVYFISPVSEFTPRNVQSLDERHHQVFALKIRIENREGFFHAGMAAQVLLPVPPEP